MYRWKITRDFDYEREEAHYKEMGYKSSVGVEGPYGTNDSITLTQTFRLVCHDGDETDVMAEGMASAGVDFEPLDDYGTPNWGCTGIEYLENGRWELL